MISGVRMFNYESRHMQQSPHILLQKTVEDASQEYNWVLVFHKGLSDARIKEICGDSCVAAGHPDKGGMRFATVRSSESKLEELLASYGSDVELVQPDLRAFVIPEMPEMQSSIQSNDHWGLDRIGLTAETGTGTGVHVYVMDTGVRVSHQEFGGRAIPTLDTVSQENKVIECNGDPTCGGDWHGHGTHTAGTTGGNSYGVAKDAILHGMMVCCGPGTAIYNGLDWIALNGIRPAITTMSLGMVGTDAAAQVAIDAVVDSGITIFVSAGNNNYETCTKTFGFTANSITVGASNEDDERARFSNFGACNDIYAPGTAILSASHADDENYRLMSGTSMATPMAAGVGAVLLAQDTSLTPAGVKSLLLSMATKDVLTDVTPEDPNLLLSVV